MNSTRQMSDINNIDTVFKIANDRLWYYNLLRKYRSGIFILEKKLTNVMEKEEQTGEVLWKGNCYL